MLYPISFFATAVALVLWYYYQREEGRGRLFQNLFFGALAAYTATVMLSDVGLGQKLGVLFRDLLVLSGLGIVFLFLKAPGRAFLAGSVLAGIGLFFYANTFMAGSLRASVAFAGSYDPQGELLLELAEGESASVLDPVAYEYGLRVERSFEPQNADDTELDDYLLIDIPASQMDQVEAIARALQSIPQVDWVEPNEQLTVDLRPARPLPEVNRRYGINDPGLEQMWAFDAMNVGELYELMRSGKVRPARKALVTILDTGVDAGHEDISGHYRSLNPADDNDPKGHGTHCAGIAAAVTNNGKGVASLSLTNEYVEVSSIKVLNASGMGSQRSIINGMIKAADAGADVISLSLGGLSNQKRERAYQKAVDYALKKGAIVVAAAGNSNRNARQFVPAGVDGVISVSAIDSELQRAVFSNYVTDLRMGLAAPGVSIYSTTPGGQYATYSGTSMAAPQVAGLLGLLRSLEPGLSAREAYQLLEATGADTRNTTETGRLIQPAAAVERLIGTK